MAINEELVKELLRVRDEYLFHRESQEVEFKEQFNFAGLADYLKDFSAFANNKGGLLIFGVKDSPRIPFGLSNSSLDQFSKLDPEMITGYLLDIFSPAIVWEQGIVEIEGKYFGVFQIQEAASKPVIAKKDEGRDQQIRNGEIYFRYGGRTQRIQYSELENIINKRIDTTNNHWLDLMSKIGKAGPQNAAILDTEKSLIEKGEAKIIVLDEHLSSRLKFIKEGEFSEKKGAPTLKLIGDVVPVDKVEVIKKVKENLVKKYPLSAMELAEEVKKLGPEVTRNQIWQVISDNNIKNNLDYSAYNFRNKKQEDAYKETGVITAGTPSIYNYEAVEFIINALKEQ